MIDAFLVSDFAWMEVPISIEGIKAKRRGGKEGSKERLVNHLGGHYAPL